MLLCAAFVSPQLNDDLQLLNITLKAIEITDTYGTILKYWGILTLLKLRSCSKSKSPPPQVNELLVIQMLWSGGWNPVLFFHLELILKNICWLGGQHPWAHNPGKSMIWGSLFSSPIEPESGWSGVRGEIYTFFFICFLMFDIVAEQLILYCVFWGSILYKM